MSFFVERTTTTHTIKDGDEEATIETRELNAGDNADIQDHIRMSIGENASPEVKLGAFRMAMVERALVSWSLPSAVSPSTIRALKPAVFEQIFSLINEEDDDAPLEKPAKASSQAKQTA